MRANTGDQLLMHGRTVGQHDRTAEILEVLGTKGEPPYRVRFDDGHEAVVVSPRPGLGRAGPPGTARSAALTPAERPTAGRPPLGHRAGDGRPRPAGRGPGPGIPCGGGIRTAGAPHSAHR